MDLQFDDRWMLATLLLWVRIATLVLMAPFVSSARVPVAFSLLFTLVLSGALSAAQPLGLARVGAGPVALAVAVLAELMTGAALGLAMQCAFAVLAMAGRLMDLQISLGLGALFDPVTRASTPVLGSVLALFGAALFFAMEGPQAFIRGISFSLAAVPLGTGVWQLGMADLVRPVSAMFSAAVTVMAPVLFLLLLVELVMMLASRVLPQMNVFFVAIPIKILVGLVALATCAPAIAPAMSRVYAELFSFWDGMLR